MSALELEGAVAAITGAGRGIGRATAAAFSARGARCCLGDLDAEAAAAGAAEIGGEARAFALDVSSRGSFAAFLEAVEREAGPPDVLVNPRAQRAHVARGLTASAALTGQPSRTSASRRLDQRSTAP